MQVLAAGTKIDRETDKNKPMPVSVVTLLVDPEQAERLTLAASEGKIQLALRNPLDRETPATPACGRPALLGQRRRRALTRPRVAADGQGRGRADTRANRSPSKSSVATSAHAKSCARSSSNASSTECEAPRTSSLAFSCC